VSDAELRDHTDGNHQRGDPETRRSRPAARDLPTRRSLEATYIADRETRLCFVVFEADHFGNEAPLSATPVDCCALYRSPRMRPAVPWLTDATCTAAP
jgi:hypothetical protein